MTAMKEKDRVGASVALIGYVCTTASHFEENGSIDHLTIHEREWAYCHGDVRTSGHEWRPTGGTTLTEIKMIARAARQNGHAKPD